MAPLRHHQSGAIPCCTSPPCSWGVRGDHSQAQSPFTTASVRSYARAGQAAVPLSSVKVHVVGALKSGAKHCPRHHMHNSHEDRRQYWRVKQSGRRHTNGRGCSCCPGPPSPDEPIAAAHSLFQGVPGPQSTARSKQGIRVTRGSGSPSDKRLRGRRFPRTPCWQNRAPPMAAQGVLPACDVGHFCAHQVLPPPSRGRQLNGARTLGSHLDSWPDHAPVLVS
ncbi:hypothetical protein NDU88_003401 [Pleurodeles waltl]|uniref:Uncharacterized protein n=1 Tax=Pleurodeles waltl TaxID=8319 RepID=A0AAV7VDX6_PLEWA|nr:hypothetical protein NDU88_003401 [Pleurodeles waltl]